MSVQTTPALRPNLLSMRRLRYPLARSENPQVTGGSFESPVTVVPVWSTLDNNERVVVTLDVSLNELIMLSSAIDVGRDIAYGDESIEIWQTWVRALNTMAICEQVETCILNDDGVKNAIAEILNGSGTGFAPLGVGSIVGSDNPNQSADNLLGGTACNDDDIMGECVSIVEALNTLAVDYIEQFIASFLPAEIALVAFEATPLLGHLTPNDAGVFLDWITDEVLTQYTGAYDTALRNEAACLLYDIACDPCALTIDNMLSQFFSKVSIGFNPLSSWAVLMADIATLSVGNQIVYGLWLSILATWKAGDTFLGMNNVQVLRYAASKSTPIDPALIGCDTCTPHFNGYTWDFLASAGSFAPFSGRAVWAIGVGWQVGNSPNAVQLNSVVFASTAISWIKIEGTPDTTKNQFWQHDISGISDFSTGLNPATYTNNSTLTQLGVSTGSPPDAFLGALLSMTIKLQAGASIPPEWTGGTPIIIP